MTGVGQTAGVAWNAVVAALTDNLTKIGLFITALTGIVTGITGCTNDNVQRYENFQTAYKNEQQFWKDLYAQYLEAADDTADADKSGQVLVAAQAQRARRLEVIRTLANKEVPDFSLYKLGIFSNVTGPQKNADKYLGILKSTLNQTIDTVSGKYVVTYNYDSSATDTRTRDNTGNVIDQGTSIDAQNSATDLKGESKDGLILSDVVNYSVQTITSNPPKNGYDYDVMWCIGGDDAANYNLAKTAARILGQAYIAKTKIGNQIVGRIRVVPLPVERQGRDGNPKLPATIAAKSQYDLQVVYDGENKYEQAIADDLAGRYRTASTSATPALNTGKPLQWYLSIDACNAVNPQHVGSAPAGKT